MIYPDNFESKLGFNEIRQLLKSQCLSTLGKDRVDAITFSNNAKVINEWMEQTREFRRLQEEADDFPLQYFFDVREALARVKPEGTHLEENELFDLKRSLETIGNIVSFLNRTGNPEKQDTYPYPALRRLTDEVMTFPLLTQAIDKILDKVGNVKDSASAELLNIRRELAKTEGSISRILHGILKSAQVDGLVGRDASPTMRDGRLVIPIAPGLKRKIAGIVHDESASGRTVFVEPTEVVEANNKIRELEMSERREIMRILKTVTNSVRPHISDILASYKLLATIDLIRTKAELAKKTNAFEPQVDNYPHIDWTYAEHPLLRISLEKQGKKVMPLGITLTEEKRVLIISGPNAGGKSVCLKTVGLLQYMLQCGLSISIGERSTTGVFTDIMIDIGDEQSIENDLSTYSSHLMNMKNMMRQANDHTLILIDEFGTGTEPQIGGAIAEAVLKRFCEKGVYGIITTHYQNLKHFADSHKSVINGAMLYDRKEMRPLFQLAIGQPGSSFAIEIARKIGLPENVINDATEIVGNDYAQSDKYLQDIVRDKRYWENKRQNIHKREKDIERIVTKYEADIANIERERKDILRKAKEQADELLSDSNKKIENTIREIRKSQADKEHTKEIRERLEAYKKEVKDAENKINDEKIARKIAQIQQRRERQEKRKSDKETIAAKPLSHESIAAQAKNRPPSYGVGDTVRIKGSSSVGILDGLNGKMATVVFGDIKTRTRVERLEHADRVVTTSETRTRNVSNVTRNTIDERRQNFHQDLDVRGMRGDEALGAVRYFIDDAILVGMGRVRILHGKGDGILRQLIRQYLSSIPNITSFADESVQFGGSGITVVNLE